MNALTVTEERRMSNVGIALMAYLAVHLMRVCCKILLFTRIRSF